jgi:hypothetical protein
MGSTSSEQMLYAPGTVRAFYLRSDDGEEEAGSAGVVEGGCEDLEDSCQSEAFGAAGGEEIAADARGSGAESDVTSRQVSIGQAEAAVVRGTHLFSGSP